MKKIILIGLIVTTIQLTSCSTYSQVAASDEYQNYQDDNSYQTDDVSYQTFYDNLSPYGQWINYPGYGNVWSPSAGSDFKPYATNGHWVYTDMGWTWVSDYNWGWATFHYGRWFYDTNYGWLWVPGYEWAPAWVSWRTNSDYYGWAPLMPDVSFSISIGSYNPPVNYWCFVPHEYIGSVNVRNYYINNSRNTTIVNNTTIINNRYVTNNNRFFAAGPNPREVEQFTHSTIHPLTIRNNNRPGNVQVNNNELHIFRPRVNSTSVAAQQRFAPANVQSFRGSNTAINSNSVNSQQAFFNNSRGQQNNAAANVTQNARQDNRSFFMSRGNAQPANNSQPVNNNFQRQVQQRNSTPVINNPRAAFQNSQARTMPVNRPNGNAYRQNAPVQQRQMIQQIQPTNHSFAQTEARSFGNRTFNRK